MMSDDPRERPHVLSFAEPVASEDTATVIAAVATLLAFAGQRVLVIDGDRARLRLEREFARLPTVDIADRPEVGDYLAGLLEDPAWGRMFRGIKIARHLIPEPAGRLDLATLARPGRADALPGADRVISRLRYDYVLISAPAGDSGGAVAGLSDTTVVSFRLNEASARPAALATTRLLSGAPAGRGVLPLATTSEDEVHRAVAESATARVFEQIVGGRGPRPVVLALPPGLHPLFVLTAGEIPAGITGLLAAIGAPPFPDGSPVPPRIRSGYRLADAGVDGGTVLVAAPGRLRAWREWIVTDLEGLGVRVRVLDAASAPGPDVRTVLVVGADDELPDPLRRAVGAVLDNGSESPELLHVRVALQHQVPSPSVDLTVQKPEVATARLQAALFLVPRLPAPARGWPIRFPGAPAPTEPISNFVNTRYDFVGREADLDRVRDLLLDGRIALINGEPGTGRRELLAEYSRRFRHDYDVCWWIPAGDRSEARRQLATLRTEETRQGVRGSPRRLLIFHNADDLEALRGLVPEGETTHVLVTSESGRAADLPRLTGRPAGSVTARPFTPDEGTEILARYLPSLSREDGTALVARLGGAPLAVHLAATTLVTRIPAYRKQGLVGDQLVRAAVDEYRNRIDAETGGDPVRHALAVVLEDLAAAGTWGRSTIALARLCSFLSPDGVSLWLLRHPAFLSGLTSLVPREDARAGTPGIEAGPILLGHDGIPALAPGIERLDADPAVVDQIIWLGARHGLFAIDWDSGALRMHRLIQDGVRTLTSVGLDAVQEVLIEALAACAPSDAQVLYERSADTQVELGRHLRHSGALTSKSRAARTWVVKQVRYVALYGDDDQRRAVLLQADAVAELWTAAPADEDVRLRLDGERANLRAALGQHAVAVELFGQAQATMRTVLPADHIRNFLLARGKGRSLRGVGRFADALVQDDIAFEGFRRTTGEDNPNTLWAANNLAFSQFLTGNLREALTMGRHVLDRWLDLQGWSGPEAWRSAVNLALYLREIGRYDESDDILRAARYRTQQRRGADLAQDRVLRISRHRAALDRMTGRPARAESTDRRLLTEYRRDFGDDNTETLLCALACAADAHLLGRSAEALAEALPVIERYRGQIADGHPYAALCLINLSAIQISADPGRAVATADEAWLSLRGTLGARHPWSVAARINLLVAQAPAADPAESRRALAQLASGSARTLTDSHPFARVAAANARPGNPLASVIVDVPPT
ncbi:hypothetical protein SAMN04489716_1006 [Actinoplanes derwentensis]|uniref:Tetratricopeptide repeat-containing protein n=3 Tax=Actinoplanes derwentensis TaxID=113562 RepID=A0A1H1T0Z6_9ACTN|nr:hypothetical protein SAMN04489716_1006 [Actinoplanes derwentensis]